MPDTLSETKACELLARLFKARGHAVTRNVAFREYGVSFHIDGWDPRSRVGFEFMTSEDEDHDDLTLGEYKTLMAAQQRGELALFIIDEVEPLSAAELTALAGEFLDEVAAARQPRSARPRDGTVPKPRGAARKAPRAKPKTRRTAAATTRSQATKRKQTRGRAAASGTGKRRAKS